MIQYLLAVSRGIIQVTKNVWLLKPIWVMIAVIGLNYVTEVAFPPYCYYYALSCLLS